MKISMQGKNNAKDIKEMETKLGGKFVNTELLKGKNDGHKFSAGDIVELKGLEDYPQFNGECVTITAIRQDGTHGRAYYFSTSNEDLQKNLNWTYEYRLKMLK